MLGADDAALRFLGQQAEEEESAVHKGDDVTFDVTPAGSVAVVLRVTKLGELELRVSEEARVAGAKPTCSMSFEKALRASGLSSPG